MEGVSLDWAFSDKHTRCINTGKIMRWSQNSWSIIVQLWRKKKPMKFESKSPSLNVTRLTTFIYLYLGSCDMDTDIRTYSRTARCTRTPHEACRTHTHQMSEHIHLRIFVLLSFSIILQHMIRAVKSGYGYSSNQFTPFQLFRNRWSVAFTCFNCSRMNWKGN